MHFRYISGLFLFFCFYSCELVSNHTLILLLKFLRDQLNLTVQLPSLNLRNLSGPSFIEQFRQYQTCEEWLYFTEKKVLPLKDAYYQGYLSNLTNEMDIFW